MKKNRPTPSTIVRAIWSAHDKHERWEALADVESLLPDRNFYRTFVEVWENSESNAYHLPLIDRLIDIRDVSVSRVMPVLLKRDRDFFDQLPDPIPVYRGTTMEDPYGDYSWSTDRDKAEWFANRCYEATPAMATGFVRKADILFAYAGRDESEIAVRPGAVFDKSIRAIGPWQKNLGYKFYATVQGKGLFERESLAFRVMTADKFGMTPEAAKDQLYRDADELEALGFKTAPAKRRELLDSIDWQAVFEKREALDWLLVENSEDAGSHQSS